MGVTGGISSSSSSSSDGGNIRESVELLQLSIHPLSDVPSGVDSAVQPCYDVRTTVRFREAHSGDLATVHFQDGGVVRTLRDFYWLRWRLGVDTQSAGPFGLVLPLPTSARHAASGEGVLQLSSLLWLFSALNLSEHKKAPMKGGKRVPSAEVRGEGSGDTLGGDGVGQTLLRFVSTPTEAFEAWMATNTQSSVVRTAGRVPGVFHFALDEAYERSAALSTESKNSSRKNNSNSRNPSSGESDIHSMLMSTPAIRSWWWRAKRQFATSCCQLPLRELRPAQISPALVASGAIHRVFMSLKKASSCATAVWTFHEIGDRHRLTDAAWSFAHQKMLSLLTACEAEGAAMEDLAACLTHAPGGAALTHSHEARACVLHLSTLLGQRGRETAVPESLLQANALVHAVEHGVYHAWRRAHDCFVVSCPSRAPPQPLAGLAALTLRELQEVLLEVFRVGAGGSGTFDTLDAIDASVGCIHDTTDARLDAMRAELSAARARARRRWLWALRDCAHTQRWELAAMISCLQALKERMSRDLLNCDDTLPFLQRPLRQGINATVSHAELQDVALQSAAPCALVRVQLL
ncbi:hypothetical protein DQ04_03371050 [Trypanosoma grayi]|uniref:hypothetical protein n=1 Tax=Trypanosoma grayi TaxID=71804 RepID=UPI0004F3F178|nr:hypothetical protein DQ04_03371050 [Trypanosoma grayi]KEG10725.1 hypothetical protein DQ04_03371050 [Trypanosoma grayi]